MTDEELAAYRHTLETQPEACGATMVERLLAEVARLREEYADLEDRYYALLP